MSLHDYSAFDPRVPFTRAEARRNGLDPVILRGPAYQRLFYDLYVVAGVQVTPLLRAHAALKISPAGSYVSHFTAAEIWRACPPDHPLTHVTVPNGTSRPLRRGIRAHDVKRHCDVITLHDLPISGPAQTFLDLAAELCLVELVVLGDSLVRSTGIDPGELVRFAEGWNGDGARTARRAARLVRAGVDSPMESRLRMLIVLSGLPEPQVNLTVRHPDGSWAMRFDLSYPALKLIIEYDGRQHAESDRQWERDIRRREELDRLGWRLIIVRSPGIYVEPAETVHRIVAALRERGARGLPRRLSSEWRGYFPGRPAAA